MNEMVERLARASFACWRDRMDELGEHLDRGRTFEDMSDQEREFAYLHAKAVLQALREPTPGMEARGNDAAFEQQGCPSDFSFCAVETWRAMVDEALK